jgi:hypothetical protein
VDPVELNHISEDQVALAATGTCAALARIADAGLRARLAGLEELLQSTPARG